MANPLNDEILASWQRSLHDKAPGTRKLYLRAALWFAEWLEGAARPEGAPGDLLAVTRRDAEAYFAAQEAAGLKATTRRSRWIALRSLYGWLAEEDEVDTNPMARVKVERPAPPPVPVLEPATLTALLKACEGKAFLDRRDLALLRLMAGTGLRRAEVAALALADVDLDARIALIRHGKGNKARAVRFDAGTALALDRYRRARARHPHARLPNLWLTRLGALTHRGVQDVIDRRARLAGIGHVHAHQLRHTFAHRYLSNGGNEGDLQRLGGWENADVMRRYGSARAVDRALAAYDGVDVLGDL